LRQITSELFVRAGLDAALNIDRESFNYAHPHVQLATLWLQRGVRQVTNRHKELTKKERQARQSNAQKAAGTVLQQYAESLWRARRGDEDIPSVSLTDGTDLLTRRNLGFIAFDRSAVLSVSSRVDVGATAPSTDAKIEALAQVLAAFGVFDEMPYAEQEELISAILAIFNSGAGR